MSEIFDPDPPRRIVTRRLAVGVLVVLGFILGLVFVPDTSTLWQLARDQLDHWEAAVAESLFVAILVFSVSYQLLVTPPIPMAAALALVGGALFGVTWGFAVLVVNSILSATLAFLAARYLLHDWVQRNLGHKLRRLNEGVRQSGGVYLFALRWTPILPFFAINMGMALTPIRLGKYVLVTALSMWPFTLMYAYAGSRIRELHHPRDAVRSEFLIAFGLLAVVPIGLKFLVRRLLRRRAGVAIAVR